MVEKGAGRTADILDMPLAVLVDKFAMLATDNLGLETDRRIGWFRRIGNRRTVTLRVSTNANHESVGRQDTRDGGKWQGRLCAVGGIMVREETDGCLSVWWG